MSPNQRLGTSVPPLKGLVAWDSPNTCVPMLQIHQSPAVGDEPTPSTLGHQLLAGDHHRGEGKATRCVTNRHVPSRTVWPSHRFGLWQEGEAAGMDVTLLTHCAGNGGPLRAPCPAGIHLSAPAPIPAGQQGWGKGSVGLPGPQDLHSLSPGQMGTPWDQPWGQPGDLGVPSLWCLAQTA